LSAGTTITPQENPGDGNPSEPQICQCYGIKADPVNTAFGTFSEAFDDFSIPGRGLALSLSHTYNSVFAAVNGPLGYGWAHSYNMNLVQNSSGVVTINQENGSQVTFLPNSSGGYTGLPRVIATLVKNSDGTFLFTRREQQFFTFSSTGQLLSERDRTGYTTTLSHNGSGQLTTVTDPAARSLTFTYSGSHLASVTDSIARTINLTYDANGNLSSVTDVAAGKLHSPTQRTICCSP
jgi:YD repeat-containing protein